MVCKARQRWYPCIILPKMTNVIWIETPLELLGPFPGQSEPPEPTQTDPHHRTTAHHARPPRDRSCARKFCVVIFWEYTARISVLLSFTSHPITLRNSPGQCTIDFEKMSFWMTRGPGLVTIWGGVLLLASNPEQFLTKNDAERRLVHRFLYFLMFLYTQIIPQTRWEGVRSPYGSPWGVRHDSVKKYRFSKV